MAGRESGCDSLSRVSHIPKSGATEEHPNTWHVDLAAKTKVAQVGLDWHQKGDLFTAQWAQDTSGGCTILTGCS